MNRLDLGKKWQLVEIVSLLSLDCIVDVHHMIRSGNEADSTSYEEDITLKANLRDDGDNDAHDD